MGFEDKVNEKLNPVEEETQTKRRRRRVKEPQQPAIPEALPNEGLASLFQAVANQILAVDKYPELAIKDEEALKWSIPHNQLIQYYFGKYGAITFVWINAILEWGSIFATRIKIIKELKKKEEDGKEDNTNSGTERLRKVNTGKRTSNRKR